MGPAALEHLRNQDVLTYRDELEVSTSRLIDQGDLGGLIRLLDSLGEHAMKNGAVRRLEHAQVLKTRSVLRELEKAPPAEQEHLMYRVVELLKPVRRFTPVDQLAGHADTFIKVNLFATRRRRRLLKRMYTIIEEYYPRSLRHSTTTLA